MQTNTISRRTGAFGLALAIGCVLNAILVVFKERSVSVMMAMKNLTGHHWITHSLAVLAVFLGLGFLLSKSGSDRPNNLGANRLIAICVSAVSASFLIIVGFYLLID